MSEGAQEHVQALLTVIARDQQARCQAALEAGQAQVRAIEEAAAEQARLHTLAGEREDQEQSRLRIEAAQAEIATEFRQLERVEATAVVERGTPRIREILLERWQERTTRDAWFRAALQLAGHTLPPGPWRVEHPQARPLDDLDDAARAIEALSGQAPEIAAVGDIAAGVRITSSEAVLDATLTGLFSDRAAVEGRLLAEFARAQRPAGEAP